VQNLTSATRTSFQKSRGGAGRAATSPRILLWIISVTVLASPLLAHAHDPFEITATVYLRTNHLELFLEMESRPARLLTGATPQNASEDILNDLAARAPGLVRLWSGESELTANSITAQPGNEDHAQLRLIYPRPAHGMFRLEAPMLAQLDPSGPYGITLTVLDLVNQKVISQSVLLAGSPAAPFAMAATTLSTNNRPSPAPTTNVPTANEGTTDLADPASTATSEMQPRTRWWLYLAIPGIVIVWMWRNGTHRKP
jgi:hypothetical protein